MPPPFQIISDPGFDRDVKRLAKKYRRINEDIRGLLNDFAILGIHGDLLTGYGRHVWKVRLTNRSANRGKSGGFRALYVVERESTIRLLCLYSKTEETALGRAEIRQTLSSLQ